MVDEDLMVAPPTSSAGSSSLPVKASARDVSLHARNKFKSYDAAFKLQVVTFAAEHSNRETSTKIGVGEGSVQDWREQK